jgi:hypothetical protein
MHKCSRSSCCINNLPIWVNAACLVSGALVYAVTLSLGLNLVLSALLRRSSLTERSK